MDTFNAGRAIGYAVGIFLWPILFALGTVVLYEKFRGGKVKHRRMVIVLWSIVWFLLFSVVRVLEPLVSAGASVT